jgi:2Fe-2S ferredoxin
MFRVHFIERDGTIRQLELAPGIDLMHAATDNGVRGIIGECGGSCACATCHVYLEGAAAARLAAPSELERELLEGAAAPVLPSSRLACQIEVSAALHDIVIRIPERQF